MRHTTRNALTLLFLAAVVTTATAGNRRAAAKVNTAIDSLRGRVRIPLIVIADSGDCDHGFR